MYILIQIIISSLLSIMLMGFSIFLFRNKRLTINKYLGYVFLNTSLWNIFVVLTTLVPNQQLKIFFYNCKFIPISTFSSFTLACVFSFLKMGHLLTKRNLIALFIVPSAFIISTFTNNFHHLFASEQKIIVQDGFEVVHSTFSYLFYSCTAYSYIIFFICFLLLTMNWLNLAKLYRNQIRVILSAMLIPLVISFIHLYSNSSLPILDLTPLSFGFSLVIFIFGVFHFHFGHIIPIARGYTFTNNTTPIIVLDIDDSIVDMNMSAETIFNTKFEDISNKHLSVLNEYIQKQIINDTSTKVFIHSNIYNVIDSTIYAKNGTILGKFKSYYDITIEQLYLDDIEYLGYHDYLTSLYNRSYLSIRINDLQKEDKLPLGILLGDLNGLKAINDTLGHKAGDEVIVQASVILEKNIGEKGSVFRVGGDEFCILIPNTNETEIKNLLDIIYKDFILDSLYSVGIALGYSLKKATNQPFNQVFAEADTNMYIEKNKIKENL